MLQNGIDTVYKTTGSSQTMTIKLKQPTIIKAVNIGNRTNTRHACTHRTVREADTTIKPFARFFKALNEFTVKTMLVSTTTSADAVCFSSYRFCSSNHPGIHDIFRVPFSATELLEQISLTAVIKVSKSMLELTRTDVISHKVFLRQPLRTSNGEHEPARCPDHHRGPPNSCFNGKQANIGGDQQRR